MQIDPTNSSGFVPGVTRQSVRRGERVGQDQANFSSTATLNEALQQSPDVRETEVTRGKKLVGDPLYPPPELIRRVARLLALSVAPANAQSPGTTTAPLEPPTA